MQSRDSRDERALRTALMVHHDSHQMVNDVTIWHLVPEGIRQARVEEGVADFGRPLHLRPLRCSEIGATVCFGVSYRKPLLHPVEAGVQLSPSS